MKNNLQKVKVKNHKMGFLSVLFSLVPIIWSIRTFIKDVFWVPEIGEVYIDNTYLTMEILLLINIVGLIFGIVSLFKSGYKKTFAIWGIVINSILPISTIISILIHIK